MLANDEIRGTNDGLLKIHFTVSRTPLAGCFRRMLKKAVQQGRSELRGEEVRTALRVGRSPLEWILANG